MEWLQTFTKVPAPKNETQLVWYQVTEFCGSPPTNRNCHSATLVGNYLLLFGGKEGDGKKKIVNDLYILNVDSYVWSKPMIEGTNPQPRMGHTAQLHEGKIVIFGGWNGFKVLNEIVFLDLTRGIDRMQYFIPTTEGMAPPRQFHTANIIGDIMYVFGGGDGIYWLNDLNLLDLKTLTWTTGETRGKPPAGRLQHSAVSYGSQIYVFGGEPDRYRQLNDLHVLETTTLTWTQLIIEGIPPNARVSTSGCIVGSKIYFFGGYDGEQWLNDLHVFNIDYKKWEHPKVMGPKPGPRCRHTANFAKGKIIIFGGNDCDISYNDLYSLPIGVHVPESSILKDMKALYMDDTFKDITFVIENDKKIRAHKCIIANRCEHFKKMFTSGMKETYENQICIPDMKYTTLLALLEFIYCDDIQLNEELACDLLETSNRYNLPRLKGLCEQFLSNLVTLDNVICLLERSDIHEAAELKRICLDFALSHFEIITKKPDFSRLSKEVMVELLQRR